MIDFHTHILPGIDDGSRDLEETKRLLKEEVRQGADCVIATPHFYANRISVEGFLRRREESVQAVNEFLAQEGEDFRMLTMKLGAEVYFFPGMGRAEKLPDLCVRDLGSGPFRESGDREEGDSRLILIEMPFTQWDESVLEEIENVIYEQELRVVLAHVERYPEFQRDEEIWEKVLDLPLVIQLNAGSFLKSRSRRKFCLNLLDSRDNVILASDCHNMITRVPNLAEARKMIVKKIGNEPLERADALARELVSEPWQTGE